MKKLFFYCFTLLSLGLNAQVYTQIEEITLNEGTQADYEAFEEFWGGVKAQAIKDNLQTGWFIWKVDPESNNNNAWAEYLIVNVFESKEQMEALNAKDADWMMDYVTKAHKGKTKRKIIKKYIAETMDNKYRQTSRTYTNRRLSDLTMDGAKASKGMVGYYLGLEKLNEDYIPFEINYFRNAHKGRRWWWELNEIVARSENAYAPVTHNIFEIPNEGAPEINPNNISFTDKMMNKYGQTTRKLHGWLKAELVNWRM